MNLSLLRLTYMYVYGVILALVSLHAYAVSSESVDSTLPSTSSYLPTRYVPDSTPVGAVLVFPEGCRGDTFNTVHDFIAEYAPLYSAVAIERKERYARATMNIYNIHQQVIDAFDVASLYPEEIVEQLGARGIHFWTAAPQYERQIIPTIKCVAFRQTAGCDSSPPKERDTAGTSDGGGSTSKREPHGDAHCSEMLARDRSGYCECTSGKKVLLECGRPNFVTCESQC